MAHAKGENTILWWAELMKLSLCCVYRPVLELCKAPHTNYVYIIGGVSLQVDSHMSMPLWCLVLLRIYATQKQNGCVMNSSN